jgi:hypothetical protein
VSDIHACDWAQQPDILIRCSSKWTTPKWANASTDVEGVYIDDEGDFYTFENRLVTCPACLAAGQVVAKPTRKAK